MLHLAKRLASLVVCLTVVWGGLPIGVRGDLSAARRPDALTPDRLACVPAQLATNRIATRAFATARRLQSDQRQPAIGATRSGTAGFGHWTPVAGQPVSAGRLLAVQLRAGRAPPPNVLS